MYMNTPRLQRGLSLVEVFVALLVLSVGLIALAKLQVDLVRGSSDARTRTLALSLAEEKVEDLRTFARTDGDGTWNPTNAADPTFVMAWSYVNGPAITTPADTSCSPACTGGRIPPQTAYSSTLEVAGVRFKRTWEVAPRDFTGTGPITSRTKDVRVTVAWQNEMGVEQQVNVLANVVEIPPGNVALASEPLNERPDGPQIAYTPGEAPEIIHIPVGSGDKRETTKPLPEVLAQGDYAHQVTFDVVNYSSSNRVERREEFVTVNCRCTLGTTGRGRTPARAVLQGTVLRDKPGVATDKPETGTLRTSGSNAVSSQPELCNLCCRDHHDGPTVDGETNRFNPTDTTDHLHYFWNGSTYTLAATGDAYDEACRMKRVNGVFQVFEDWNLVAVTVMPNTDLEDGVPTQAAYIDYVADVVREYIDSGQPNPVIPTFSTTALTPGGAVQLQGRAIYIDYMTADQKAAAATLITGGDIVSVLKAVPWYEVNLSKLAKWKLQTTGTTTDYVTTPVTGQTCSDADQTDLKIACVTSEAVRTEALEQDNYSRGVVIAGPDSGTLDAQAYVLNGNTGLIDTQPLTAAAGAATPISDEHPFSNDAGSAVTGKISKTAGSPSGNPWSSVSCNYTVDGGPSTSCGDWLTPDGSGANDPRYYSFNVPTVDPPATVVVTVTYSAGVVCPADGGSATNGSIRTTAPATAINFTIRASGSCPP